MTYNPSNDEINLLLKQVQITKNQANKLLIKHNGDMEQCILDVYEYEEKNQPEPTSDISKKLLDFRKILDEKDTIFQQYLEKNKKK